MSNKKLYLTLKLSFEVVNILMSVILAFPVILGLYNSCDTFTCLLSWPNGHMAGSKLFSRLKSLFTRSVFKDPIFGFKNWKKAFRRSDFKVPFLW